MQALRSQTLRCSESCDTLVDLRGANIPTAPLIEEHTLGCDKGPLSLNLACNCNPVSCNQENCVGKKVLVLTVSVDHRDA